MKRLLLTLLLASCGEPPPECERTSDCDGLKACLDGACREVDCLASADCLLEQTCDVLTYTCEPGCTTSDDCLIGDRCDPVTSTCVKRPCTATQADCALGERCDLTTGECRRDPLPYCERCRGDEDCGPTGLCAALSATDGAFCLLPCSPEAFDACPAGLQCALTTPGTAFEYRCVGLCDRLD